MPNLFLLEPRALGIRSKSSAAELKEKISKSSILKTEVVSAGYNDLYVPLVPAIQETEAGGLPKLR